MSKTHHIQYPFVWLLILISGASCTDVIDLDLRSVAPKYVVEGILTQVPGDCRVLITQTKDFDGDNHFPGIGGATVTITTGNGDHYTLSEQDGAYIHPNLVAEPEETYTLQIWIGDVKLKAQSTMPQPVSFDSLYITRDLLFGEFWLLSNVAFMDPSGVGNAYNFIQYINGRKTQQIYVFSDDLSDGNPNHTKLYMMGAEEEKKIHSGDTVEVEMQCIDQAVYRFWYSADQSATGADQNAAPANPVSNIQGDALGYFSAHTTQRRTVVVE